MELVLAIVFAALGVRSLVYWARRPFASRDARDHLLYGLYVMGRAGLWFAFAGIFLLFASAGTVDPVTGEQLHAPGQAFIDAVNENRWFVLIPAALAATQFVAGYVLGRRGERARSREEAGDERVSDRRA
ncbi:MAG TPA: hypothetical protein VLA82_09660 [Actinomycetota bacterium]|nr:hypothetical protein [Actinomycetota bacterium]